MSKRQTHEQQVGWRYYGSFATAICRGPVDVLHSIQVEDVPVFEGPIDRSTADADGMTEVETDLGTIRFYWGTETQNIDQRIRERANPVSAYRGVCYYVADHILWGDDRANPPHLTFDLERKLDVFPMLNHDSEGDVSPVEALFAFLTDADEGLGLEVSELDLPSWEAAAETVELEGVWCSVEIDDRHSGRDIIARHLELIRGRLIEIGGKVGLLLDRPGAAGITIGPDDLLEEPAMDAHDTADIFSEIYVRYRDRDRRDEEAIEGYVDEVTSRSLGRPRRLEIDMHWVRQRDVARLLVAREGYLAAAYQRRGTLTIRPTIPVAAGDRLTLDYAKGGLASLPMVVLEASKTVDGTVIDVAEDIAIDPLTLAIPDAPDVEQEDVPFAFEPFVARFGYLPPPFRNWSRNGWFAAVARPHWMVTSVEIKFRKSGGGIVGGKKNLQMHVFPAACEVLWMAPLGDEVLEALPPPEHEGASYWVLRVRAIHSADRDLMGRMLAADGPDVTIYAISQQYDPAERPLKEGLLQVLELVPGVMTSLVAPGVWQVVAVSYPREGVDGSIRFNRGAYPDTPAMRQADGVDAEIGSGRLMMIGPQDTFLINNTIREAPYSPGDKYPSTAAIQYAVGGHTSLLFEVYEDPDGQTQKYGTHKWAPSPPWVLDPAEEPTPAPMLPEFFDDRAGAAVGDPMADMTGLTDIDEALGRIIDGTDTPDDAVWAGLDEALERYYDTGYYGGG